MEFSANPNPSPNYNLAVGNIDFYPEFELSDFLMLDDSGFEEEDHSPSQSMLSWEYKKTSSGSGSGGPNGSNAATSRNSDIKYENELGARENKIEEGHRIAFRTKSEMEVLDDGYKWRKYGKKSVKNSPNPRNYYKCSSEGCHVKKRIERDRDDSSYVLTTYEGVHNHESPCMVYCNLTPPLMPFTLQPNSSPSSST